MHSDHYLSCRDLLDAPVITPGLGLGGLCWHNPPKPTQASASVNIVSIPQVSKYKLDNKVGYLLAEMPNTEVSIRLRRQCLTAVKASSLFEV